MYDDDAGRLKRFLNTFPLWIFLPFDTLSSKNCEGIFFENDEEIKGLSLETILEALNSNEEVSFSKEY